MYGLRFKRVAYDELHTICFTVFGSNGAFSGGAELYAHPVELQKFALELQNFPINTKHIAGFEYGNISDNHPYHVVLRAQVMDGVGHSAIFVRIQSFCGSIESGFSEFYIGAEPASINELGVAIIQWLDNSDDLLCWQPKC